MSTTVAVIGAGIVGLSCAYYLRREGHDVVVLDREQQQRDGTSFGNAGMIVPSHFVPLAAPGVIEQGLRWMRDPTSPFYVRARVSPALLHWGYQFWRASRQSQVDRAAPLLLALNQASHGEYRDLEVELGGFGLDGLGLLMLCATEHGLAEEAVVAVKARSLGLEARVLARDELAALEPDVSIEAVGAVHYTGDGHLDPGAFMAALERWLVRHGAEFQWGAEVESIATAAGRATGVVTRTGAVRADAVVVAAGSWSAALARTAGVRLLIEPGKGYSMTIPTAEQRLRTPAILSEARVAVSPLGERLRVGGTMELTGFGPSDSASRVKGIVDSAVRYLPGLDRDELLSAPRWQGLRPCTPDGLPYLGSDAANPNLVIATGHAMLGVSLAPITGRLVADIVAGRAPRLDIAGLDPNRHQRGGRRTGGRGRPRAPAQGARA
jgi:D-amino-acid dehydrogenase